MLRFLQALYLGAQTDAFVVLFTKITPAYFVPHNDLERVISTARGLSPRTDTYFGVCLQGKPPRGATVTRGTGDTAVAMPGLWFDVDCAGGNHKKQDLPTLGEATEFVNGGPLGPPAAIVHSGGGLHAYWLFDHPRMLEDGADRERAQQLSTAFQLEMLRLAKMRGWALDNTSDLARVLRLPGTWNHKYVPPRPVELALLDEGRRITALDAAARLPEAKALAPAPAARKHKRPQAKRQPRVEVILAGCPWLRHCQEDAESLPEPEWYAALSIVGRCHNGENLAHEFSSPYPGYSPRETQYKLRRALTVAGPRTCRNIGSGLTQNNYCSSCDYRGKVGTPLQIGAIRTYGSRGLHNRARPRGGTVHGRLPGV